MNPKIFTFTALLLLMAGSFYACTEKNQAEPFLTVDETLVTVNTDAGTYSIAVSSNGEWTAIVEDAVNDEWCTLTNASGANNGTVIINVAENTATTPRSATVKITLESLTKSVVINQTAAEDSFPIDIPFTGYSLAGTSCQWQWSNIDFTKLIVIIDNEEFENYISCTDGNYPEIDFSEQTLLLARGSGTSGIVAFEMQFQQISMNEYSLYVDITRDITGFPQGWFISIKIPKLSQNSVITLDINDHL